MRRSLHFIMSCPTATCQATPRLRKLRNSNHFSGGVYKIIKNVVLPFGPQVQEIYGKSYIIIQKRRAFGPPQAGRKTLLNRNLCCKVSRFFRNLIIRIHFVIIAASARAPIHVILEREIENLRNCGECIAGGVVSLLISNNVPLEMPSCETTNSCCQICEIST